MNRISALSLVLAASISAASGAAISGVSGSTTWLGVNPPNAQMFNLSGPNVFVWNEQVGVTSGANVNIASNGTFTGFAPYTAGTFSGGFASHMVHFDPGFIPPFATGSVSFTQNIVAVIFDESKLSATDASMGALTTTYDTGSIFRSFNADILGFTSFTVIGNTLHYQFMQSPGQINRMFEARVITVVPTPGSLALIGLGGLVSLRRRAR
ncbi:MAG: hypothetical protein AABZ53_07935 [Planctomycetota bacterium]